MTSFVKLFTVVAVLLGLNACTLVYVNAPPGIMAPFVSTQSLPPLAQRLPDQPQVITPIEGIGQTGGTLRSVLLGRGDFNGILRLVGNQGLVRWKMDFNGVEANLAESWTVSADASEYVFKLRRGTRWSDGAPFTADDVVFSMNEVVANRELFAQPMFFSLNGRAVDVSRVDEYSVRFKFAGPNTQFLEHLAMPIAQHPTMWQRRYCSQFMPQHNRFVAQLIKNAGVSDWVSLFRLKCADLESAARWNNADRPTLDPWVVSQNYTFHANAQHVVLNRNPYFWQVDSAGNQLPYIDRLWLPIVPRQEDIMLAATNGLVDFQLRYISGINYRPQLAENQVKGGYKLFNATSVNANSAALWFNFSTKNAKLKALILNHDFRQALSQAIDRKEINDIVHLGQATPWQIGPLPQSKWYNEKLGKQYLEYDPKLANELLDKLGLSKRGPDGYRSYADGGRVSIVTNAPVRVPVVLDSLALLRKQWAKVGIELVFQPYERTRPNYPNDYDLAAEMLPGGLDAQLTPRAYLAVHLTESRMSLKWAKWYETKGLEGEEPSASMKKRLALYDKWRAALTGAEADELFKAILQEAADEFEVIGTVTPAVETGIRSARLHGVYPNMPSAWAYPTPAPTLPQQWFFK